jgi:hypothetical protein
MSMLVSRSRPVEPRLHVPLVELLLDFGAAIEGCGARKRGGPLLTTLVFGMGDAAKTLAKQPWRADPGTTSLSRRCRIAGWIMMSDDGF